MVSGLYNLINTHHPQCVTKQLQCLLRIKEDLSVVLIFQDAKNNVQN